jgi:hypothetical protein
VKRLLAAVAALAVLSTAGAAAAQSMAEAAAKERERRARQQKEGQPQPRVLTNDDLDKAAGRSAPPPGASPPPAASGAARGRASDNPEQSLAELEKGAKHPLSGEAESQAANEASWRSQAAAVRKAAADAEARLQRAESEAEQLAGRIRLSTDTYEILRLSEQKQAADKAVAEASAALQTARAETEAFEERARRAGVPPGWIR